MTYTIISTVDARRQNDNFFVSLFFQILPSWKVKVHWKSIKNLFVFIFRKWFHHGNLFTGYNFSWWIFLQHKILYYTNIRQFFSYDQIHQEFR